MKRKTMAVLMSVLCVMAAVPSVTVFADGQRVVTLGADLSDDQKQANSPLLRRCRTESSDADDHKSG